MSNNKLSGPRVGFALLVALNLLSLTAADSFGDVTLGAPSPATVRSCDDYFTDHLNNPADMSDTGDVNYFFPAKDVQGFTSASISNGVFSATTDSGASHQFYLWSPFVCGSYPVGGRFGAKGSLNFNTAINFTPALAQKYNRLSVRLYHPSVTLGAGYGVRARYDRDCSYDNQVSLSGLDYLQEGWHTYTFDLTQAPSSGVLTPWTSGDITGLSIEPTQMSGAQIMVDWVRLEDPSSCNSVNSHSSYTATVTNNNNLLMFYLDSDTNPFNGGYTKRLLNSPVPAANGTISVTDVTGVPPGLYNIVAVQDSDYATLNLDNPWDFNENDDVLTYGGFSSFSISGGMITGTTASDSSNIYLKNNGIDAATYKNLSIRITGTGVGAPGAPVRILWNGGFRDLRTSDGDYAGSGLWNVNLSTSVSGGSWSGTVTDFIIRPTITATPVTFALDFVSLRASGFDSSRTTATPQIFSTGSQLRVNNPPVGSIVQPGFDSGQALRPWNMNSGDFALFTNLRGDADPSHPGENYTSYLPDVRLVDGLRGDFFKGGNIAGNGDPNNHSVFPIGSNPITFAASDYSLLCYKMLIDYPFSLQNGSHARVLWENSSGTGYTSEDLVAIYDGWKYPTGTGWYEYCLDMNTTPIDGQLTNPGWNGMITKYRVDPDEFSHDHLNPDLSIPPDAIPITVPYYFDRIKLRANPTAHGKLLIMYNVTDSDTASPTVSLFYNTTQSTSGGTLIPGTALSCEGQVCIWDTSAVPNGSYYLYGTATDSLNSSTFLSPVRIVIDNSVAATLQAPVLSVAAPSVTHGDVCDSLQIKGYALQSDAGVYEPVSAVQVFVDGMPFSAFHPDEYSPAAKSDYPNADSSDSGFNKLLDATSISPGMHTVVVKAYGINGATTSSAPITITKKALGCADPLVDADPAGSPINPPVGFPPDKGANLALSIANSGANLLFSVSGINNGVESCTRLRLNLKSDSNFLSGFTTAFDGSITAPNSLQLLMSNVPRLAPKQCTVKQKKAATLKQKKCTLKCKGKKKQQCVAACKQQNTCANPSGGTTVYFKVDCGDGTGNLTTSVASVDATKIGADTAQTETSLSVLIDDLRKLGAVPQ